MQRRNHQSVEAARCELRTAGFWPLSTNDGIERWGHPKSSRVYGIAREERARTSRWHLVELNEENSDG